MKLLSIELGVRCNNRCRFCYQRDYRRSGATPRDPSTDEVREKLRRGRAQGFEGVGFSGGEPTARPDLVELVSFARQLGYERVSLTTNGRRLAERDYRRALLRAGVDAVGWSVHGASPAVHDAATGVAGSFAELVAGLRATLSDATRLGRRLDPNVFVLVTRDSVSQLARICLRFHHYGVRLFVFQPLVYSRGNLAALSRLSLSLEEVREGVARAAGTLRRLGGRSKTFNLPPCLFSEGTLEEETHRVRVFREHERRRPGEAGLPTPVHFFRLSECRRCPRGPHCPGVHASLLPQSAIRDELRRATDAAPCAPERWLGGLELADADTLCRTVAGARAAGAERIVLCTGGDSVLGDDLPAAAAAAGVDAIRFVVHRREPRSGDRRRATRGNLALVRQGLLRFREQPASRTITRSVGMLLERSEAAAQEAELRELVAVGAQEVHLEVAVDDPELSARLSDALRLLYAGGRWRRHAWARKARVTLDVPDDPACFAWWRRRAVEGVCAVRDVRGRFLHSRLTGPGFGWITDSVPAVALPADFHHPERWPPEVLEPIVLEPERGPRAERS